MTIELGPNRYGKSAIRLVKIVRDGDRHTVRDLTVDIVLEGDFTAAHTEGDNANVVATDTMKNTVYALAQAHLTGALERFAIVLARHHLQPAQCTAAVVTAREHHWARVPTANGPAGTAFVRSGELTRTARVRATREGLEIASGIEDLVLMKTAGSGFSGFPRDAYTTLPEVADRIMATKVTAEWGYADATAADEAFDFDASFEATRATLLDVFAIHDSPSVQASVWVIGRAILEAHPSIQEVRMRLPNLHHWLVDLGPFGQRNDNEIFVATTQPHGLIEATVRRS